MSVTRSRTRNQRRILGISGAVVIGLTVLAGVVDIYFDRAKTMRDAYTRLENLARIADESVSGRLRTIDLMLKEVAQESMKVRTTEDEARLLSYMVTRSASLKEVRTISIVDASGKITLTTLEGLVGFDGSDRPYFKEPLAAQNRDKLFIHGPFKAATGAVVLFVARTKAPPWADWDGVVVSSLPPEFFASIMDSVRPQDQGFAALLGNDGTIVARSPDQAKYSGTNIADGPAFVAHKTSGQKVTRVLTTTSTEHKKSLVVLRTPEFSELVLAVGWPEDFVLAPWREKAMVKGAVLLLLAVIGSLVLRRFTQYEVELLQQRNFARQLVETANVMVVGTGPSGHVRLYNAAAEALTGYDRKEVQGRAWLDMLKTEEDLAELKDGFWRGTPKSCEFTAAIGTKSGQTRTIAWRNSVVSGNPEIAFMAFGMDITERLEAEQQLDASKRFLSTIADNMPGMIGYWDSNLRCRFANKPYQEWFRKPLEDILGRTVQELLDEKLLAHHEPYIQGALRGEMQRFERSLTNADGTIGYTWTHYIPDVDEVGTVLGFFVLINDITPLKRTELELRDVSDRLAVATKAGGIGVWSWDLATDHLVWDDRMYSLYGLGKEASSPIYETWQRACHPADLDRVEAELAAALEGRAPFDTEFRILLPDGRECHIKAAGVVEKDSNDKPVRMVGVNWDVTPLREGEKAVKSAQERAERASRAKSEFLANMSHEIRTPMNAILGLTQLLERSELPQDQREMVGKIGIAGRSLLSIINDILDFSKVEAGRLELEEAEFHLNDLLSALSTIMSVNASAKDLELVIAVAPDTPTVLIGDTLRLQQILINLVSNAIKFTDRGEVSLRVEQVNPSDGQPLLRFSVKDTGIGMASDVISKIFDPFLQADSTTTRRFGGSGLGLAICKRLVGLMGGQIGVDSQLGRGSTFWFTVPLKAVDTHIQDDLGGVQAQGLEVLIADDHLVARDTLSVTANSLGWTAEAVGSGQEALDRARERLAARASYDVLILDWQMPNMDGLAVAKAVRGLNGAAQLPIVVMVTAYAREDLVKAAGADAIDAVLIKPVTASSLFNAVMEARARRRGSDAIALKAAPAAGRKRLAGARLLLVEDNSINQDVAKRILELEGADVSVVSDGQQAVDTLAASRAGFDAVLMDIQMPVMDGYEATSRIRNDLGMSSLPIIALTAGALDSERSRAQQVGMDDFVAKPFDVDKMVNCIRSHVTAHETAGTEQPDTKSGAFERAIPGIDMAQVALRLGGDDRLFASLLKRLYEGHGDTVAKVRAHVAASAPEEALRLLHAFRGAAGNLSANEVALLAGEVETAIRQGSGAIPDLLDRLEEGVAALRGAIADSGLLDEKEEALVSDGGQALNRQELDALVKALRAKSMTAVGLFEQLRPSLMGVLASSVIVDITGDIEKLHFRAAVEKLEAALVDE